MPFDLSSEYLTFDAVETVTFRQIAVGAPVATQVVAGVLRRALDHQAADLARAGLALESQDQVFHLPAVTLAGLTPRPGDQITDSSGAIWTILAAERATLGTRWACRCRQRRA